MKRLNTRTLLATGLVSLVISVLLVTFWLGLIPDQRDSVRENRAALAEVVAAATVAGLGSGDVRTINETLTFAIERNTSLKSVSLRKADGTVVAGAGDHSPWVAGNDNSSTDEQLVVPLSSGGRAWGRLELRFDPLVRPGLAGVVTDPRLQLIAFMALSCFMSFSFYLRRMLKHLDPSQAVPDRVRSALDTLAEGLLLIDRTGMIVLANQSFSDLVGITAQKLTGRQASKLAWKDGSGTALADGGYPWVRAMADGVTERNIRVMLTDATGKKRSFLANCSPIQGEGNKTTGVLMSLDDVTELQEKEALLREATALAESANRAKSDFLANMSHEIRTPMSAVLGFTELLRRGMHRSDAEARRHLDTIHSNGKHLLELINDILDLSKIEAGRLEVERIDCEPHKVIQEVIDVLMVRAQEKGIGLLFSADGPVPASVCTDPSRLRQIVTNLVGNAIKFTTTGNVKVHERWRRTAQGSVLEIDIIDSGIGIDADKVESIFQPFVQAESSTTRRFGGTGLGLSISRNFARALGGDIVARSRPGLGSTFVVTIDAGTVDASRMLTPEAVQAAIAQRASALADGETWRFPAKRVLVVDDTAENRQLVRLVLEETGLQVDEAENGQVAVAKVLAAPYDMVLMDMQMPVMDGFTATRKLRAQGVDLPIVAFTAHALKGFEKEINEAGCSGHLTKPIDIDAMLNLLSRHLGGERVAGTRPLPGLGGGHGDAAEPADRRDHAGSITSQALDAARDAAREPIRSRLAVNAKLHPVILSFALRLPQQLEAMHTALNGADFAGLSGLAHWLKGSAGSVGFDAFTEPAKLLEAAANASDRAGCQQSMTLIDRLAARIEAPSRDRSAARPAASAERAATTLDWPAA